MTLTPYYETELGKLYHGDCLEIMPELEPVDLVVTSPPYDDLREYGGYVFNFYKTAFLLRNLLVTGGVIVWVVGDATINGSETGTSARQKLFFKAIGLNIHDTMIYEKENYMPVQLAGNRYANSFEYMFVFSKNKPKTVNLIKTRTRTRTRGTVYNKDGSKTKMKGSVNKLKIIPNIWSYCVGVYGNNKVHPAIFPRALAQDHILSWSNERDLVLDPMCGSGTTCKMAEKLNRRWIGIEIEEKYCEIAAKRIEKERSQLKLWS